MFFDFGQSAHFREQLALRWETLYRVAYSWCHDPHTAGDLVQESLAKALKNRKQLRDWHALDTWLFKIMNRCWIDLKRRQPHYLAIDDIDHVHHQDPEAEALKTELTERVWAAVGKLKQDQRQVVSLVSLGGLSYDEVANALDIPIGTVMSRLCRARRTLRAHLDAQEHQTRDHRTAKLRRIK